MSRAGAGPSLGVIVPCHDEAGVIARKLRNLAGADWPQSAAPHRLIVVDDHSADATAAIAERAASEAFGDDRVRVEVLANPGPPGKATAVGAALDALGESVELIVLTDADVIVSPDALLAITAALVDTPSLGMVCARQRFVETLGPGDDDPRRLDLDADDRAGLYDRLTAQVRALESRGGRLFSVHGQLLAWRAELQLRPTAGIAADDLELMVAVRRAGRGVAFAEGATFVEAKPDAHHRRSQQLRRARAYAQIAPRFVAWPGADLVSRLQLFCYRVLPLNAHWWLPLLLLSAPTVLVLVAPSVAGILIANLLALAVIVFFFVPAGRRFVRLLSIIATAKRMEARTPLSDRWEMPRS